MFSIKKIAHFCLPLGLLVPSISNATIADTPLFVNTAVQPNIFFLVDDSGSMDWEVLQSNEASVIYPTFPNSGNVDITPTETDRDEILESCVGYNVLYFDPNETYVPWEGVDINGNAYTDQSITAARLNPYDPDSGTIDLTSDIDGGTAFNNPPGYVPWLDDGDNVFEEGECADPGDDDYVYLEQFIATTGDFGHTNVMTAAQQQNFANWYTYYRKREYVMKSALLNIASTSEARLGLGTLHRNGGNGFPIADIMEGTNRADLMQAMSTIDSNNGTPLRRALEDVGEYFEGTTSTSLFGSVQDSPILSNLDGGSCQQNFAVVMSDGFWNGGAPNVGNADSGNTSDGDNNVTDFDGGSYADQNTGRSNTLADVAMHFYERDLDTGLDDDVPSSPIDPNDAQHLVTYTVAFGVNGTLDANPTQTDTSFDWPNVTSGLATTIDDMRHAAWNGRGEFLAADSPSTLIQAFSNAVASIAGRTSSASSVATNSTRLQANSSIFQARFTTTEWTGDLLSFSLNPVTGAVEALAWNAANRLPDEDARNIFTFNTETGSIVPFEHANLGVDQRALLSEAQVNYMRGDQSGEGSMFRSRSSLLGDIVNSDPVFTSQESQGYFSLETISGEATYDDYLIGTDTANGEKGARAGMIYVGANDGMLHALLGEGVGAGACDPSAQNCQGEEMFAYMPKALYSSDASDTGRPYLPTLTDIDYEHKYFVDNTPVIGDAFINFDGAASDDIGRWGTALVGTLGAGGRGIFALDISNPLNFSSSDVLWDVDHTTVDSNGFSYDGLGNTFAKPSIVKLTTDTVNGSNTLNNEWGVVVGNGYGSGEGAILYVLGLRTGEILWKQVVDTDADNGLSTPLVADTDGDQIADRIYAGDLKGNMWVFDISNTNDTNNWQVAKETGQGADAVASPLFTACAGDACTDSNRQPITSIPQAIRATVGGVLVFFGTGQYFEVGDNLDASNTQSFYAILDDLTDTPVSSRTQLQEQTITGQFDVATTGFESTVRTYSENEVNYANASGWFIDLFFDGDNDGAHDRLGERIISEPILRNGRVIFNTLIPELSPCSFGGSGFLVQLDAQSGARLDEAVFDVNGDGVIDDNDFILVDTDNDGIGDTKIPASDRESTIGITDTGTFISNGDTDLIYESGSSGDTSVTIAATGDKLGRQSWIQVK